MCLDVRAIYWSKLCETDCNAYVEFLAAVRAHACAEVGCGADDRRVSVVQDGRAGDDCARGTGLVHDGEGGCGSNGCGGGIGGVPAVGPAVTSGPGELAGVVGTVAGGGAGIDDGRAIRASSVVSVGSMRGDNYLRNRRKRERAKARRAELKQAAAAGSEQSGAGPWRSGTVQRLRESGGKGSYFSELPECDRTGLKESYAQRLRAENDLKCFQAQRRLELEKAKDLGQMMKRQETYLMSQTEMNKVRAEKAFATLARTDNVPGVVGSAKTVAASDGSSGSSPVFSGVGSGTISPNSSISLAEIHALQKRELENAHKVEKLEARLEKLKLLQPDVYKDLGFLHALPPTVGTGVTVDENGSPVGDYGDGFAGYLGDDGRFHFGENYDNY